MDAKTIENARRGDRQAQAKVLRTLQDPWFRFCLGLLGNPELARDATQETAVRFLQRLPTWRGDGSLKTWSFGIALNVVREMRRRTRPIERPRESGEPSPADELEHHEARDILRAALDELPQRQREAIVLRFFAELTTDQTAGAMNVAVGTVKATVHQALRSLREKLRQLT